MTFSDPHWLWGLVAVPLVALFEWRAARRAGRALRALAGERGERVLLSQRRPGRRRLGIGLRLGALALLVLGAAGPEWGREVVRRGSTGSDVVFVMDVSASMDARDVAPSRLEEAKREALAVLDRIAGSRIGVVAFAGDAVRLCPLTPDLGAARLTLESLSSGSVSEPGTDLGRALRRGAQVLPGGRRDEQVLVVWTDGEDLEQGARPAIEELARAGIRVFAVGVGTPAGDVVPVLDDEGRAIDVKRDANGGPVRSRLDEGLLRTLARATHGGYFQASRPGGELPRLLAAIGGVGRAARGERLVERPVARFPLCAALAALLLAVDVRRSRRRRAPGLPGEAALHSERRAAASAALLVAGALLALPSGARAESAWARGDRAFRDGRFAAAESLYALRLRAGGPPAVRLDRALARARGGKVEEALPDLGDLANVAGRVGREARYDYGTLLGLRDSLDQALAALRDALERNPTDDDARWNYEVLMRRKAGQQGSPEPRPQPSQPSQPRPNAGGGSGAQPPQPLPSAPRPQPPGPSPQHPPAPRQGEHMDRAQAERILDALQDLARSEQQRRRQVRVIQEKRGRDW